MCVLKSEALELNFWRSKGPRGRNVIAKGNALEIEHPVHREALKGRNTVWDQGDHHLPTSPVKGEERALQSRPKREAMHLSKGPKGRDPRAKGEALETGARPSPTALQGRNRNWEAQDQPHPTSPLNGEERAGP